MRKGRTLTPAKLRRRPAAAALVALFALVVTSAANAVSPVSAGASPGHVATVPATSGSADLSAAGTGARAARARNLADTIGAHASVRQLVTVSSAAFGSTHGMLKAWRRNAQDEWVLAGGPAPVVVGYNGWVEASRRKQGTGTTPAGRFTLPYAFGRLADPGARLDYRRVDGNDWWPYEPRDPATYNVYQRHKAKRTQWRGGKAERLDSYTAQYGYALVVGFNLPRGVRYSPARRQWVAAERADTRRGGGIFLHVRGDGFTAGCVAMSRADMRWLVRWVRPGANARIVMGPREYIVTL